MLILLSACFSLTIFLLTGVPADAAAAFQNNYPDASKPCLAGDPRNPKSSYGKASGSGYWCAGYAWGVIGGSENSSRGYGYRNCTDWAAFRAKELTNAAIPGNLGNANTWDDRAPGDWKKDATPEPGDIAQTDAGSYGHVGVVEEVRRDAAGKITSIVTSSYNSKQDGTYGTEVNAIDGQNIFRRGSGKWDVFIDVNGTDKGIDGQPLRTEEPVNNTVLDVARRSQSDGVNLVYWAKAGTVFESWWRPGGDGVHNANIVGITQQDIRSIDAEVRPDGQHLVYTATARYIWETWWYPGKSKKTEAIIFSEGNKAIQKAIGPDGSQQLYVMSDRGVDEYWWRPGGAIQRTRLFTLAGPVAFKKMATVDGEQLLFIADRAYVYEISWRPGGTVRVRDVAFIAQRDITALDGAVDPNGQRRVYAGRQRDGVWEATWYAGQTGRTRQIAGGNDVRAVQFYMDGSAPVVYVATSGGVFEYWWLDNDPRVRGAVIAALTDVHDIERGVTADHAQALYTAANTKVYESWWWPGGSGIRSKALT